MADFNFYLNRQGAQGRKGDKGDAGFSPNISVSEQTLDSYKLKIVNEYNEFETPNLLGNLNIVNNGGTYLRYDKDTETISAGEIDGATTETVGGVKKASTEDLSNLSADSVVTPANVADMLPLMLEAGTDNVTIEQDEETSKTKISVSTDSSEIIEIKADINTIKGDVSVLENRASEDEKDISNLKTSKQDVLTAGDGIKIENNTISTTGGSGTDDVTATGDNTFTGENTFTSTNNFNGTTNLNGITNLNGVNTATNLVVQRTLTSSGEIEAVSINATGIRSDDIQTTTGKKYLNESNLDGQTISMVDGKVHVNMDELGNEVNDLSGRVTAAEADITTLQTDVTDINGDLDKKQAKLTAGNNITLTDNEDGTQTISASGGGSTELPIASADTLGGVKIGDNLSITSDGVLSANANDNVLTGTTTQTFDVSAVTSKPVLSKNWKFRSAPDAYQSINIYQSAIKFDDLSASTLQIAPNINSYGTFSDGVSISKSGNLGIVEHSGVSTYKLVLRGGGGYQLVLGSDVPKIGYNYPSTPTLFDILTMLNTKAGDGINITNNDGNITISSTVEAPSVATTSSAGIVRPDGSTITITEDGTISAVGGGSGDVTAAGDNVFTGSNTFNTGLATGDSAQLSLGTNNAYLTNTDLTSNILFDSGSSVSITRHNLEIQASGGGNIVLAPSDIIVTDPTTLESSTIEGKVVDGSNNAYLKQNTVTAGDNITITKTATGIKIDSTGGDSTPANMVTTDTSQTITANKLFTGEIRVGNDSTYSTLAKFSNEELVDGDSTLLEHVDLGEANFVVEGNLGKKVYENDAYAYKKYINVDDLSDNTRQYNNTISSQVAHMAMPSSKYIELTLGASGTTYTAPADGWFYYYKSGNASNTVTNAYMRVVQDTLPPFEFRAMKRDTSASTESSLMCGWVPILKGNYTIAYRMYDSLEAGSLTRFYYCVGQEPTV